jgi:hypothetical protein
MSEGRREVKIGEHATVELEQLCESVRSLEHAIWVAAGAYFAVLGFGLNWMYQSADDRLLTMVIFVSLLLFQGTCIAMARIWVNGSVRMMERMVELTEGLEMEPEVPQLLVAGRRRVENLGTAFMVLGIAATVGLFAVAQRKLNGAAHRPKQEPTVVRILRDSVVPVLPDSSTK